MVLVCSVCTHNRPVLTYIRYHCGRRLEASRLIDMTRHRLVYLDTMSRVFYPCTYFILFLSFFNPTVVKSVETRNNVKCYGKPTKLRAQQLLE